jgi:hypothetical protein
LTVLASRPARSRRRRALRILAILLTAIVAIPVGVFMLVGSLSGDRR